MKETTYGRKIVTAKIYVGNDEETTIDRRIQIDTSDGPEGLEVEVTLLDPIGDQIPDALLDDLSIAVEEAFPDEKLLTLKVICPK